jgi:nitric oxide reductase NorF protein
MTTSSRRLDGLWLALIGATALTWALGESGLASRHLAWPAAVVFALSLAKGAMIALDFMELREAPPLWRRFVIGWLLAVVVVILGLRWTIG